MNFILFLFRCFWKDNKTPQQHPTALHPTSCSCHCDLYNPNCIAFSTINFNLLHLCYFSVKKILYVKYFVGVPRCIQMDRGTENVQVAFHSEYNENDQTCVIKSTSPHNQVGLYKVHPSRYYPNRNCTQSQKTQNQLHLSRPRREKRRSKIYSDGKTVSDRPKYFFGFLTEDRTLLGDVVCYDGKLLGGRFSLVGE